MNEQQPYTITPVESYDGCQWRYVVKCGEETILKATTGGTGPCWTLKPIDGLEDEEIHICDLDSFVGAVNALRGSDAHKANVKRWA